MHHTRKLVVAGLLTCAGCAHPAALPATSARARVALDASSGAAPIVMSGAQQRAQRAWCAYLDMLHQRAMSRDVTWSHHDECLRQTSTASPEMLERTASCARTALEGFQGDPLTAEYAAEVRRCGSEALDASALSSADLEPFLDALCTRAQTCDGTPIGACRGAIPPRVSTRLARAIGALNEASRARLRACVEEAPCTETMGARLAGCVEPIMEKLLWLPTGHDR